MERYQSVCWPEYVCMPWSISTLGGYLCKTTKSVFGHGLTLLVEWVYLRNQSGLSYLNPTRRGCDSADLKKCLTSINVAQSNSWQVEKRWRRGYISELYNSCQKSINCADFSPTHSTRHVWTSSMCRYGSHQNFSTRRFLVTWGTLCYQLTRDSAAGVDQLTPSHEEANRRSWIWYYGVAGIILCVVGNIKCFYWVIRGVGGL